MSALLSKLSSKYNQVNQFYFIVKPHQSNLVNLKVQISYLPLLTVRQNFPKVLYLNHCRLLPLLSNDFPGNLCTPLSSRLSMHSMTQTQLGILQIMLNHISSQLWWWPWMLIFQQHLESSRFSHTWAELLPSPILCCMWFYNTIVIFFKIDFECLGGLLSWKPGCNDIFPKL